VWWKGGNGKNFSWKTGCPAKVEEMTTETLNCSSSLSIAKKYLFHSNKLIQTVEKARFLKENGNVFL